MSLRLREEIQEVLYRRDTIEMSDAFIDENGQLNMTYKFMNKIFTRKIIGLKETNLDTAALDGQSPGNVIVLSECLKKGIRVDFWSGD